MRDETDLQYPNPPAHVQTYVRVLGSELAVDFLMAFGGAQLYIAPNPKKRSPVSEIARTLHVSDVSVRSWLKKQPLDPRQKSLF